MSLFIINKYHTKARICYCSDRQILNEIHIEVHVIYV